MIVDPAKVLELALTKQGQPCVWGRKGPNVFDCSGLVTWAIHQAGGPDLRFTHNAHLLWKEFPIAFRPALGEIALAFYGYSDVIEHVMFLCPDGRVFGACGARPDRLDVEEAKRLDEKVRFRNTVEYRKDFLGFRYLQPRPLRIVPKKEE